MRMQRALISSHFLPNNAKAHLWSGKVIDRELSGVRVRGTTAPASARPHADRSVGESRGFEMSKRLRLADFERRAVADALDGRGELVQRVAGRLDEL